MQTPGLHVQGLGFGREQATVDSEEPLRADGLVQAIRAACEEAGLGVHDLDFRITDLNGEQYGFKEATLALSRTMRKVKPAFDIWHPANSVGDVGSAIGPCVLGLALSAFVKGYAPGPGASVILAAMTVSGWPWCLTSGKKGRTNGERGLRQRPGSFVQSGERQVDLCHAGHLPSPPSPPAGPVPDPYPNTGMATDTGDGSKTVVISGKEVMLKDSSSFQKSTGDEAATKSLGMGVVTHQIQGKVFFTSWSMDVMIEGENAVRDLDTMTHNHMSKPGNTPPWVYQDAAATSPSRACKKEVAKAKKAWRG